MGHILGMDRWGMIGWIRPAQKHSNKANLSTILNHYPIK